MNYNVYTIPPFDRQLKRLARKFPSLKDEYLNLLNLLSDQPFQGAKLANNCYKIRLAVKSKSKGKSGGLRVIANIRIVGNKVYLLSIYDKSEQEDISDSEINYLLSFID